MRAALSHGRAAWSRRLARAAWSRRPLAFVCASACRREPTAAAVTPALAPTAGGLPRRARLPRRVARAGRGRGRDGHAAADGRAGDARSDPPVHRRRGRGPPVRRAQPLRLRLGAPPRAGPRGGPGGVGGRPRLHHSSAAGGRLGGRLPGDREGRRLHDPARHGSPRRGARLQAALRGLHGRLGRERPDLQGDASASPTRSGRWPSSSRSSRSGGTRGAAPTRRPRRGGLSPTAPTASPRGARSSRSSSSATRTPGDRRATSTASSSGSCRTTRPAIGSSRRATSTRTSWTRR